MSGSSDQRLSIRLSFDGAQEARAQLEQLGQVGDTAMRKLEAGGQAAGRGVAAISVAGDALRSGLGQINGDLANTQRQFEALANSTLALTSALRSGAGLAGSIGLIVTAATAAYAIYENWSRITGAMTGAVDSLTGRFRDNSTALEQANTLLNEYNRLTEAAAVRTARLAGEAILARQAQVSLSQETLRGEIQGLSGEIDRRIGLTEGRVQAARRGLGGAALSEESERILQMEIDRTRQRAANNPEVLRLRAEIQQREGALQELERRRLQFAGEYAASQENVGSVLNTSPAAETARATREARAARAELTEAEREYQRLVQQGVQLAGTAATEQQRYGEQVLALSAALGSARITQEQYNAAVAALDPAARAAREAQEQAARQAEQFARRSRDALAMIGENAMDRIGTGLVNAFVAGGKAALDFQSLMKGVIASIAADLLKLAVVTPITNSIFGTARPTLAGAFPGGGAQSSAPGGGMLGSLGSFMPSMGGGSGLMGSLGLSGIGASVSGFMAMPLFGSAAQASATNSALAGMPGGMMGPAAPSSLGLGATTVGSFLGSAAIGAGLGIAGGNFAGGLRGTANPMPGSLIGTGLGMGLGFLVGGPVGMAIGGALGGTAGGMFGPTTKGNASRAGGDVSLGTDANGQLIITGARGKRWDQGAATAEVQAQLDAINAQIGARGLSFAGAGQAAIGFGAASGSPRELSMTGLARQLRSNNANQMAAFGTVAGRGGNLEQALQAADFVTQIYEPLDRVQGKTSDFRLAMDALTKTYDEAITKARDLGLSEAALQAQREERMNELWVERFREGNIIDRSLDARRAALGGDVRGASLIQFDLQAEAETRALKERLRVIGADEVGGEFVGLMVELEQVLASERLAVMKQFSDQAQAQAEAQARAEMQARAEAQAQAEAQARAQAEQMRAQAERVIQGSIIDRTLGARRAILSGDTRGAGLMQFDLRAEAEGRALRDQLRNLGFDEAGQDFARRMLELEQVLADERLAVMREFDQQAQAQAKEQAERMRSITQGLLEDLTLGGLGGLAPEARFGAGLSMLNNARGALADGATVDELAEFSRVAQNVLPIAKDFLGISSNYAELVADVSRTLRTASPGNDPANLGAILEASLNGSDRVEMAILSTGQSQTGVLQTLLTELRRLTTQNEALLARQAA